MSALTAGSRLCDGRYRLDEVLGRGGMAIVWAATDLQLERRVAIKLISDVLAGDAGFAVRFEREARLAAGLNHPNLVKLFDFGAEDERPFLIMEHIGGGTLADRRTEVDATELAAGLLDALAHMHRAGIVHRDVKPANVLIGLDGHPRLTDFGIARSDDQTGLTLTGQVMGTLRYIAPEVADGQPATPRSDLYSLGVMLGEVAGPRPEPALARLIDRLRDPDPARRPASAEEALAELDPTKALRTGGEAPVDVTAPLDPAAGGRRHIRVRLDPLRIAMLAGLAALVVVLIILANGGGGGDGRPGRTASPLQARPQPAPGDAPLDGQLVQLEKIVRSAPRR